MSRFKQCTVWHDTLILDWIKIPHDWIIFFWRTFLFGIPDWNSSISDTKMGTKFFNFNVGFIGNRISGWTKIFGGACFLIFLSVILLLSPNSQHYRMLVEKLSHTISKDLATVPWFLKSMAVVAWSPDLNVFFMFKQTTFFEKKGRALTQLWTCWYKLQEGCLSSRNIWSIQFFPPENKPKVEKVGGHKVYDELWGIVPVWSTLISQLEKRFCRGQNSRFLASWGLTWNLKAPVKLLDREMESWRILLDSNNFYNLHA